MMREVRFLFMLSASLLLSFLSDHIEVGVSLEADGHWLGVSRAWRICSRR
jgi:hypothetical protein